MNASYPIVCKPEASASTKKVRFYSMNEQRRPTRDNSDPAKNQMAIILGFLIIGITLCCCLVTVLGWTRGALNVLG